MTFQELMDAFPTEDSCREYLFNRRWPDGVPRCPRCGKSETVYNINQPWKWECSNSECRTGNAYRFSILVGTIFENTKIPLLTWFKVLYTILQSKKVFRPVSFGVCSLARLLLCIPLGTSAIGSAPPCKTLISVSLWESWKLMRRTSEERKRTSIEASVSIVTGGIGSGKIGVIGAISRKGNVVCQIIEDTSARTLEGFVRKAVSDQVSLIATDQWVGYKHLNKYNYRHETVDHMQGEYVRGEVHTANLDSFWALLKRGIIGTYHNVSKKYLPLYLAEFQFRHNNRKNPDIFGEAVAGC